MADTYTSSLRIAQQEIGANENTWGTINNAALARLDQAVAGIESISVASGNVTLTTANNADDQARNALLIFTGSPGATRTVTFPNVEKLTWVINSTGDGSSITCTAGAGTAVTVLAGWIAAVYGDGATNMAALINMNARVSGQIVFPATQNASSDANTLDDYEEGSWTPAVAFGGGSTGITYTVQVGIYTKIGNRVLAEFSILLSNKGSSTGSATITGQPFTLASASTTHLEVSLIDLNVGGGYYSAVARPASTSISLLEQGDNLNTAVLTDVDFSNTSQLIGGFSGTV